MKFKEIKPGMVIHCPTEEDARALLEHLDSLGYVWRSGEKLRSYTNYNGMNTCYTVCDNKSVLFSYTGCDIKRSTEFADLIEPETLSGKEVIEWLDKYSREIGSMPEIFPNCKTIADVVENYTPECIMEKMTWYEKHNKDKDDLPINSPTDSPMSAVEVLEWLQNNLDDNIDNDIYKVFGNSKLDSMMMNFTAKQIVKGITAYEAAKKAPKLKEVECGWHCHIYTEDESKPDTIISIPAVQEYDLWGVTECEALEDAKSKAKKFTAETGQMALAHVWFKCRVKEG